MYGHSVWPYSLCAHSIIHALVLTHHLLARKAGTDPSSTGQEVAVNKKMMTVHQTMYIRLRTSDYVHQTTYIRLCTSDYVHQTTSDYVHQTMYIRLHQTMGAANTPLCGLRSICTEPPPPRRKKRKKKGVRKRRRNSTRNWPSTKNWGKVLMPVTLCSAA
eukprot:3173109-Rhodomonas_salina.1